MELGSPALYVELNRVMRDQKYKHLKQLGPYAMCLCTITFNAEKNRNDGDMITTGKTIGGAFGNIAGIFLLFRGA